MSQHDQLITETKESLTEYVPKLIAACDQISEMAQNHQAGWVDLLDQFFEGTSWVIEAVAGIRRLESDEYVHAPIDEIMNQLQQLAEALEQKDMVAACDILQFEIKQGLKGIIVDAHTTDL